MKQLLLFGLLFSSAVIISCQKDEDENLPEGTVEGAYTGRFHRSGGDTVTVQLTLNSNGTYQGSSSREKYPAVCGGNYVVTGNTIEFNDTCAWTADFDWTLILDGSYNLQRNGADNITISRGNDRNGENKDEYLLTRLRRS